MQTLGVMDAKTLHRRREDYRDKSVHPDSQFFKLGVHYLRKSPTSKTLVWDQEATVRAWVEATKVQSHLWKPRRLSSTLNEKPSGMQSLEVAADDTPR
jgi:hypothetical protein